MAVQALPDLTPVLLAAQSPDAASRGAAEAQLEAARAAAPPAFLLALATELAGEAKPAASRQIAGLILKNALDAPSDAKKAELAAQWNALDAGIKAQIRQLLLATLGSQEPTARHTAALVVAKAAAVDLPARAWPELLPALLATMAASPPAPAGLRTATLQALGYVCEEMGRRDDDVLEQAAVNAVLTAVVAGMRAPDAEPGVRLAATCALSNALEFAATNFENEDERNYLMQVVCEGAVAADPRVREAAFECLAKIAAAHYEQLPRYMTDLFALTHRAVRSDDEDVAKMALEFWCTIAEEEAERDADAADAPPGAAPPVNHRFVTQALAPLTELLLEQLTKQEDGQDADAGAWNVAMAAGTCLGLAASATGDAVVPLVMPYVQANIGRAGGGEDWRWREAATFAFGSILDGPSPGALVDVVASGLGFLLAAMRDPNSQVRHTTAWTLGRVFEFVHGADGAPAVVPPAALPQVVAALLGALRDEPHVAEKACYAISQLAEGYGGSEGGGPSPLSPHVQEIMAALLDAASRAAEHPGATARGATTAFEALNDVVRAAPPDAGGLVAALVPVTLQKLAGALAHAGGGGVGAGDVPRERALELCGSLCGVLTTLMQRLCGDEAGRAAVAGHADQIMEALLAVFAACGPSVSEDAMLAAGALTYGAGPRFAVYLPRFAPVLKAGIEHYDEWQVCLVSVGVLGDVARCAEAALDPHANDLVGALLACLRAPSARRDIKPHALSALGDVALAVGDGFERFLPAVLPMLASAAGLAEQAAAAAPADDGDAADYVDALRVGTLEAWAGLFNGLSRAVAARALAPQAPAVLAFVEALAAAGSAAGGGAAPACPPGEGVLKAAVSLLGDVAAAVPGVGPLFQSKPALAHFVEACRGSADPGLADAGAWALQTIGAACGGG